MLDYEFQREFNTLVLNSRFWTEFEIDRPVGRSFRRIWLDRDSSNLEDTIALDPLVSGLRDFRDFLRKSRKSEKDEILTL